MIRLSIALTLAVLAMALFKLYRDSHVWREWPYIDDRDWLMESDPYIMALRALVQRPPRPSSSARAGFHSQ